jgi:hypothetical protein
MLNRRLATIATIAAITLLSFASSTMAQKNEKAEGPSCPVTSYGELPATPINTSRRMRIKITYFEADDVNAFISEKKGLAKSASYQRVQSAEFTAKLERLEQQGVARVWGEGSTDPYFGEVAQFDLNKKAFGSNVMASHAGTAPAGNSLYLKMERQTEAKLVNVSKGLSTFYRVALISSYITFDGKDAVKNVDLDASILLVPGQTALFKLTSDAAIDRSIGRTYMAVTIEPVSE